MVSEGLRVAVLIDADNVSPKVISGLLDDIAGYGIASVRRVYGDWQSQNIKCWVECVKEHALMPVHQPAYVARKNATDIAMVIDAMDLLYTGRFEAFCLVTSDSDFTRLAARIQEQGVTVYGYGNRHNTHKAFRASCDTFVYLDTLGRPLETAVDLTESIDSLGTHNTALPVGHSAVSPLSMPADLLIDDASTATSTLSTRASRIPLDQRARDNLRTAVSNSYVNGGNFAYLAQVGECLKRLSAELHPRNYGYGPLLPFVRDSGVVDIEEISIPGEAPVYIVRLKE